MSGIPCSDFTENIKFSSGNVSNSNIRDIRETLQHKFCHMRLF